MVPIDSSGINDGHWWPGHEAIDSRGYHWYRSIAVVPMMASGDLATRLSIAEATTGTDR